MELGVSTRDDSGPVAQSEAARGGNQGDKVHEKIDVVLSTFQV